VLAIIIFVVCHWYFSLFFHSFFLHRYGAHKQFLMSKGWERFFFFMTWFTQGSSFLNPRSYAVMHRMHHAYSDGMKDPHSPHNARGIWHMMVKTYHFYHRLFDRHFIPNPIFTKDFPEWKSFEHFAYSRFSTLGWVAIYIAFYAIFATSWWMWLFIPINIFNGPIQGAIVNWSGHKYGYVNFDNHDHSRNSLPMDILLLGELFQNNHHMHPMSPNFGKRWFEFDPTYPVIKALNWFKIIRIQPIAA
jgi:stearoyl-CoA desaturase (delta-9 desaturase)